MMERPSAATPQITTCNAVPGYAPQIGHYVAQMNEVRRDLKHELSAISGAQLDWHPDEQTESIGTQLLHIAAIEWSWLHEDIFGTSATEYPGSWEEALPIRMGLPQISGQPLEYYWQHLEAMREQTLQILAGFTDDDLSRLVGEATPAAGEEPRSSLFTIDWIIWHVIQHEAAHVGQIELLRRLAPAP